MNRRQTGFAIAVAVLTLVSLFAGPSGAAGPLCEGNGIGAPDARVREDGESFEGAGEFGTTTVGSALPPGGTARFVAKWENVSGKARRIRVDVNELFTGVDVKVRIRVNDENVTDALAGAGAVLLGPVEPGRSTTAVEVVIRNKSTGMNSGHVVLYGAYGHREPPACDAIEVITNAS